MARTREEACAYQRGYETGRRGDWPLRTLNPASIPERDYAALVVAARRLEGAADVLLAGFDDRDEDPHQVEIDAARDQLNEAIVDAIENAAKPVDVDDPIAVLTTFIERSEASRASKGAAVSALAKLKDAVSRLRLPGDKERGEA